MTEIDVKTLLKIARAAGDAILDIYNSGDIQVETKTDETGHQSPLTLADTASHRLICSRLEEKYPDIPLVSEEQTESLNLAAMRSAQVWVIDPIDGTKGFVKRNGEFTINIGLLENGVPVLGVVYAPVHNLMYYSDRRASYLDKGDGPEKITASTNTSVKSAVASKNHMDDVTKEFLEQFGEIEIVQAGSSLKLCKVASGEADIYPRLAPTTMEWDTAAADAIIRTAGGKMIDETGETLAYNKLNLRNQSFIAHAPNVEFNL